MTLEAILDTLKIQGRCDYPVQTKRPDLIFENMPDIEFHVPGRQPCRSEGEGKDR